MPSVQGAICVWRAHHREGDQIALAVVGEIEASFQRDFVVAQKRSQAGELPVVNDLVVT